ncbi:MAG: hypothetical protein J7K39_08615, partial [Bacteroidales bacterium]|nr:hypothetical protein [Bacteroidales bacterium]
MKKTLLFFRLIAIGLIMLFSSGWAVGQVIISQYIETSSGTTPKGIEVWNVSGHTIDFSKTNLSVYKGTNGGDPSEDFTLSSGTFAAGDVIVIGTDADVSGTGTGFKDFVEGNGSTFYSKSFTFNGDDALVLYLDGVITDVFGTPNSDPGSAWTGNGVQTNNQNISLISGIGTGDTDGWTDPSERFIVTTSDNSLDDFGVAPTMTTLTWNGNGTDWNTDINWTPNTIPTPVHNVSIPTVGPGLYPIISNTTSASCNDLTLTDDGTLTIASLTDNSGSLIIGGNYSGSATAVTYNRYMTGDNTLNKWHLLGSPFTGQGIGTFLSNNPTVTGMKAYNEGEDNWENDYTSATTTQFSLGQGYAIKLSASGSVLLTGTPNTSTVDITLTYGANGNGWNLLSNPFTSAIAANTTADASNNLLTINESVLDPSYTALYVWDETSTSYLILNHTGGSPAVTLSQDYLQAGQGFFVRAASDGATFSMTTTMQKHQTAVAFKSAEESTWASIMLNAETSNAETNTSILYRSDMNKGLDIGYDAGLFGSNPDFALYSRLVEDYEGINFMLQALPEEYETLIVPIGLDAKAG